MINIRFDHLHSDTRRVMLIEINSVNKSFINNLIF